MKPLKFITLFSFLLVIVSCNKDDSTDIPNESIQQLVENFVTPDVIFSLRQLGFTFKDGNSQPSIEGSFTFSSNELKSTNIENDIPIGTVASPVTFVFSNLSPESRTFSFVGSGAGNNTITIIDTFYSGTGNIFSAYVKYSLTSNGETAILILAFSGKVTEIGIENAEYAQVMLDNMGNPNNIFIDNGKGRRWEDRDGTATRQ